LAAILASFVLAAPVAAGGNGAQTFTQTMKGPFTMHVDASCGVFGGTLSGSGNSVFHVTTNKAGDFWLTTTQEAWFTIVPDDPTLPNFAGHFAAWFGISANSLTQGVIHDIANIKATATDGSGQTVTIHAVDHLSISASGQINMFMDCH
jgi:hypothetical protein